MMVQSMKMFFEILIFHRLVIWGAVLSHDAGQWELQYQISPTPHSWGKQSVHLESFSTHTIILFSLSVQ